MPKCFPPPLIAILSASFVVALATPSTAEPLTVHKRSRVEQSGGNYAVQTQTEAWQPEQTAIIVCDMWDAHHCLNAVRREVQLAPAMNRMLATARDRGVLIIHAPSHCIEPYADHPARKRAQAAPEANNLPTDIGAWCRHIPAEDKGKYPIDQTDGGEDDDPEEHRVWHEKLAALGRNPKQPWKRQIDLLEIKNDDAISDSGVEIWNLLEQRGIKNVVLCGVHTNMCVLGRPFGLRQLSKNGKNVVLLRDMTDTMYNPAKWPYVNHFQGTELIVEHIEKFVCPSITSTDITGQPAFRFAEDKRKVVMVIGDDEYKTEVTLPAFAKSDLEPLGFDVKFVHADPKDKNQFPGLAQAVENADVLVVSARRRTPPKDQLEAIRKHVAAGKPVVGIRTASHAWSLRGNSNADELRKQGLASWPEFDAAVLGGNYTNHYGNNIESAISAADNAGDHPVLRGVDIASLVGNGSLYKVSPLGSSATPLLMGTIPGQKPEPVAWTNVADSKSRVFYTSLGHEKDFENPAFRKLLANGLMWTIAPQYVGSDSLDELLPTK